ncbi:lipoprotein [Streptomyces niveiscabiei]|uniref:lipoprotein n=1 Tax=Streptomyces niveiscabiei TaxID=164115 RepID=UPI0029AE9B25|nr:lipoprotein [Streptomyces niveiscabiei]MDX3384003.1 lipoprotein [Streptomyces niveiscabiei]
MRRGMSAVLMAGVLAGCGTSGSDADGGAAKSSAKAQATPSPSASASPPSAASGGTLGAKGSACELPVTFQTAAKWKAESIAAPKGASDDLLDALLRQGPVTGVCEIDAKPAGHIGFIRVYQGKPGDADARTVLKGFVAAEKGVSEEKYATFTAGSASGVEVSYRVHVELMDETKSEHALAVTTPEGPVIIHLGGIDDAEHKAMLPALDLAKRTLRVTA